jgi:hypothetical protein
MQYWIRASAGMLAATFLAAGQPAADKCRIEGTVLNAVTGQPIRKARITLTPVQGEPILVATDAHGKYALADLAPGKYSLLAGHDGYTDQRYGAKRPGEEQKGEQLELTAGSVKTDVDLKLTPLGAIMGFVRDEDGDPVRQVDVALLAYAYGPSGKKLRAVSNAQTDALGEYRLFDLLPGTYYLRAKPMSAQSPGTGQITEAYAAVFYPNSQPQSGAGAVELTAGQEQRGIDFVLHQIPVSFIRGRIVPPVGGAHCLATLEAGADELQPSSFGDVIGSVSFGTFVSISDNGEMGVAASGIRPAGNDNRFEFHNVPLGNHTLGGRCAVGKQQFTTKMPIQLDAGGLDKVDLHPVGPSTITGQIRLEGESKSKLTDARVIVGQSDGMSFSIEGNSESAEGKIAEDGTFSFHDLSAEIYQVYVSAPGDLYVKSITEDGRDIQDSGIDLKAGAMSATVQIVLSASGGSMEGSVENGAGAKVILIPSDPQAASRLAKTVTAGDDGHFAFTVLAPGRYKVFAWEDVDPNAAMYDAEFRKPFESKGQTVEVGEKQKATAQLQLIPRIE